MTSVMQVAQKAELKRHPATQRRLKMKAGLCRETGSRLFAYGIDKSGHLNRSIADIAEKGLPRSSRPRVMALIDCKAEDKSGRNRPCFIPANPIEKVANGFKKAEPGEMGICLSEADPAD